jgi:hypothetical protein
MSFDNRSGDRIEFKSAVAVRKFSLPTLRRLAGQSGEFLEAPDLEYANELLAKGYLVSQVIDFAIGWANEYARTSEQEGREAAQFHADAYGA